MTTPKILTIPTLFLLPLCFLQSGCTTKTLVFSTATKFGLDISQQADKTIDVNLGYDRAEVASIPVSDNSDASSCTDNAKTQPPCNQDAYSVLGIFNVEYGNPWPFNDQKSFELHQFFATGIAARKAAKNPAISGGFGKKAGEETKKSK